MRSVAMAAATAVAASSGRLIRRGRQPGLPITPSLWILLLTLATVPGQTAAS